MRALRKCGAELRSPCMPSKSPRAGSAALSSGARASALSAVGPSPTTTPQKGEVGSAIGRRRGASWPPGRRGVCVCSGVPRFACYPTLQQQAALNPIKRRALCWTVAPHAFPRGRRPADALARTRSARPKLGGPNTCNDLHTTCLAERGHISARRASSSATPEPSTSPPDETHLYLYHTHSKMEQRPLY